jgi:CheY-like chemotaxis protein
MQSVLAVDDSASIRGLVSHVLNAAGYDVVLAEDGQEALEYAREYEPSHSRFTSRGRSPGHHLW